jgi:hypothetical protein
VENIFYFCIFLFMDFFGLKYPNLNFSAFKFKNWLN